MRHFLNPQNRAMPLLKGLDQLRQAWNRRIDDLVAQHDCKWFVSDQMLRAEYGVSKAQGFRLTHVTEIGQIGNVSHLTEELRLSVSFEVLFQFHRPIEMVFDGALPAAGDDDDVFNAGGNGLFHRILNQRLVDQRKHFFGRRFGRGEKSRAEPGSWKNGFAYFGSRHTAIVCDGVGDVKESPWSPAVPARLGFGPDPLYIEVLAPYNPGVFHTGSWLMLQRHMRKHLTSATFIAAVIDGFGSLGCGAQMKGVMSPLIEAFLWGMHTLSIVWEPGASEGGVVPTMLVAVGARVGPVRGRPGA